jgi:hypothetical protein
LEFVESEPATDQAGISGSGEVVQELVSIPDGESEPVTAEVLCDAEASPVEVAEPRTIVVPTSEVRLFLSGLFVLETIPYDAEPETPASAESVAESAEIADVLEPRIIEGSGVVGPEAEVVMESVSQESVKDGIVEGAELMPRAEHEAGPVDASTADGVSPMAEAAAASEAADSTLEVGESEPVTVASDETAISGSAEEVQVPVSERLANGGCVDVTVGGQRVLVCTRRDAESSTQSV